MNSVFFLFCASVSLFLPGSCRYRLLFSLTCIKNIIKTKQGPDNPSSKKNVSFMHCPQPIGFRLSNRCVVFVFLCLLFETAAPILSSRGPLDSFKLWLVVGEKKNHLACRSECSGSSSFLSAGAGHVSVTAVTASCGWLGEWDGLRYLLFFGLACLLLFSLCSFWLLLGGLLFLGDFRFVASPNESDEPLIGGLQPFFCKLHNSR